MEFKETMRAEQAPDVYCGATCDQHEPRWVGCADGDMDGPSPIGKLLRLSAETFPPGTKVSIQEPRCPRCDEIPTLMNMPGQSGKWECGCDFDWHAWTETKFA